MPAFLKIFLILAAILSSASARSIHGFAIPAADTICTITTGNCTGVGAGSNLFTAATCNGDGTTDDAAAFRNFNSWAIGTWQVAHPGLRMELDIASGKVCQFISGSGNSNSFGAGFKRFQVAGYGAQLNDNNGTGQGFQLGGAFGVKFTGTDSTARLATVTAGSSCVNLLDATKISLWNAGDYSLISGIDPQGFGDPPNPIIFEWPKVASTDAAHQCDGTTAGASVHFTAPLINTYKSTWPLYNPGRPGLNSDNGGPATLYQLNQDWDTVQAYYGLSINQVGGQTNAVGRDITLRDMSCPSNPGGFCVIPSQNLNWRAINFSAPSSTIEIDKIVTNIIMQVVSYRRLLFQQGPVSQTWTCNNCSVGPIGVTGSSGISIVSNSNVFGGWSLGASAYGASGSVTVTNTAISDLTAGSVNVVNIDSIGIWSGGTLTVPANMSVSSSQSCGANCTQLNVVSSAGWTNGIVGGGPGNTACAGTFPVTVINPTTVTIPLTFTGSCAGTFGNLPLTWAIPAAGSTSGANIYLVGNTSHGAPGSQTLQVSDLSVGPNNETIVTFSQNGSPYSGGLPVMAGGNPATVFVHPAPSFSCTGCTGPIDVADVNGLPVGPYGSQATRVVTAANSGSAVSMPVFGPLAELDMTVTAPCSGSSNMVFNSFIATLGSSTNGTVWNTAANAQTASATPRVMTPTTTSGAQGGDSLVAPGAGTLVLTGQSLPAYSNLGNCGSASTTVTVKTNQGVVYP